MGKTWKKKENHIGHVGDWNGRGEEYGHNYRSNAHRIAYKEFCETDEDYPKMRSKSVPPNPYEDQKASGRIRPDNSRFNHRSMKKAKEERRYFEETLPNIDFSFENEELS